MPANIAKDNPTICSWADRDFGPTHVVSQVSNKLKGEGGRFEIFVLSIDSRKYCALTDNKS